jgi:hypothetical protein
MKAGKFILQDINSPKLISKQSQIIESKIFTVNSKTKLKESIDKANIEQSKNTLN